MNRLRSDAHQFVLQYKIISVRPFVYTKSLSQLSQDVQLENIYTYLYPLCKDRFHASDLRP